ncbi:MAG TPA: hypothetical protein VH917_03250 [Ignavibacteriaceae bacterium]
MIINRIADLQKGIIVKDISFLNALADCTSSCGWCVHRCPDKDKYEILVLCIKLQNEFAKIWKNINSILPGRIDLLGRNLLDVFTNLAEMEHRAAEDQKRILFSKTISEKAWQMPGCSQIFMLANILDRTYLNGATGND